ncbi:MAG: winged helix DNA-binding protein [Candidatus Diapherotrites archaeon]|nr:winged helix DNA-binding protein [Candidatus Diapherotrites archaeon]
MGVEVVEVLFKKKPAMSLIFLKDKKQEWYASKLAKRVDCTYPHMVNVLKRFEKSGFVNFNQDGRKKLIVLTEKGHEIAGLLQRISGKMN